MTLSKLVRDVVTFGGPDPLHIGDPETAAATSMATYALHDRPVTINAREQPCSFESNGYGATFIARNGLTFGWRIEDPDKDSIHSVDTTWQFYIRPNSEDTDKMIHAAQSHSWEVANSAFVS